RRAMSRAARTIPKVEGMPLYQRIAMFHERNGSASPRNRRNTEIRMPKKYRPTPNIASKLPRKKEEALSLALLSCFRLFLVFLARSTSAKDLQARVYLCL